MAGSIAVTISDLGGSITKYAVAWIADGSGNVSGQTFPVKRGRICGIKFVPGSPAPTTGHVVKVLDTDSADILAGSGAAVSGSAATYAEATASGFQLFLEGWLLATLSVTGAGAAAQATLIIYVGP